MGKGDKKTRKGKISSGSYGVTRKKKNPVAIVIPKAKKKATPKEEPKEKAAPVKKATAKAKKKETSK